MLTLWCTLVEVTSGPGGMEAEGQAKADCQAKSKAGNDYYLDYSMKWNWLSQTSLLPEELGCLACISVICLVSNIAFVCLEKMFAKVSSWSGDEIFLKIKLPYALCYWFFF